MKMTEVEKLNDKCNKLKALVIREKKVNVENAKTIAELNEKYSLSSKQNDQLTAQLQRLSLSIGELQSSQETDIHSIEGKYREEVELLKQELQERDVNLEETLQSSKEELERVVDKLTESTAQLESEQRLRLDLDAEKKELIAALDEKDGVIASLQVAKSEMGRALKDLDERMRLNSEELAEKLDESKRVICDLEKRASETTETSPSSVSLELTVKNLEAERVKDASCMESLRNSISELRDQLEAEAEASEAVRQKLDFQLSESERIINELREEIDQTHCEGQKKLDTKDGVISEMQASLDSNKAELTALASLRSQLAAKEDDELTLRTELLEKQNEIDGNLSDIGELQSVVTNLEFKLEESSQVCGDLEMKVISLSKEVECASMDVNEALDEKEKTKEALDSCLLQIKAKEALIEELSSQLKSKEIDLVATSSEGGSEMDEMAEEISSLRSENSHLKCQQETLENVSNARLTLLRDIHACLDLEDDMREDLPSTQIMSAVRTLKETVDCGAKIQNASEDNQVLMRIHEMLKCWLLPEANIKDHAPGETELCFGPFEFGPLLTSVHAKLVHGETLDASHSVLEDGMMQMSRKCGELEEAVNEMDQQLHCAKSKLNENAETMDELETDIASRDEQVEQLQTMVEDTRNIVRALEREKDALQSEIIEVTSRSEEKEALLAEEIRELRTLVSAESDSIHEMQMSSDSMKDSDNALSTPLSLSETRCQELGETIKKQSEEICGLESELSSMRCELQESNREKEASLLLLSEERHSRHEEEMKMAELRQKIEAMQAAVSSREKELQMRQRELEEQVLECDRLRSTLHETEEKVLEQEALQKGVKEELTTLERTASLLQENEEKVQELTLENEKLRRNVDELNEATTELRATVNQKSEQLEASAVNEEAIRTDNDSLRQSILSFESRVVHLQEEFVEKSKIDAEVIAGRDSQLLETAAENDRLRKALSDQESVTSELRRELALTCEQMDAAAGQGDRIASLSSDNTQLRQRVIELEALSAELGEEIAQKSSSIETLSAEHDVQLKQMADDNDKLHTTISELELSMSKLHEEANEKSRVLEQTAVARDTEFENALSESDALRRQVSDLESLLEISRSELSQKFELAQATASEADSMIAQLRTDNASISEQNVELKQITSTLREELAEKAADLKQLIEEHNQELKSLAAEKEELRQQISALELTASELREDIAGKSKLIDETTSDRDARIAQLTADNSELSLRISELRDQLNVTERLQQNATTDADEAEVLRSELNSLQSQLSQLKTAESQNAEKMTKMKNLVMKLKRELAEANKSREDVSLQLEKLEKETAEERDQFEQSLTTLRATLEGEAGGLRAQVIALEQEVAVQRTQSQQLMAERLEAEEKVLEERTAGATEVKALQEELQARERRLEDLQAGLTRAERDGRQRTVMDLELAEFERAVESLKDQLDAANERLKGAGEEIEAKEACVLSLQAQIRETDSQRIQSEERANKLKQMLVKTKRELAECRRNEEELRSRSLGLSSETETVTSQLEACKLDLATASAEKVTAEERVGQLRARLNQMQHSQESAVTELKSQLSFVNEEKKSLVEEFTAYKAKAQAAFRRERQPSLAAAALGAEEPAVTAVRQRLEAVVGRLKDRKEELEGRLEAALSERDSLQRDFDRLQERLRKTEADVRIKETQWDQRLARLSKENNISEGEHLSALHQLTFENELLARNHRDQLRERDEEHANQLASLQTQIEMAETENERLQSQVQQLQQQLTFLKEQRSEASNRTTAGTEPASEEPWSPAVEAIENPQTYSTPRNIGQRMQAEGMEQPTEVSANGKNDLSRQSSYVTFEQLLTQPQPPTWHSGVTPNTSEGPPDLSDAVSVASAATAQTDATVESLRSEVVRMERRGEHLSELLSDSESMVQHLTEQANVLKSEIRRHEMNAERKQHIENSEYLKNVVMKFITLASTDERRRLVPVMATVLSLTKDERTQLMRVAEVGGLGDVDSNQAGQGWSSYFHWSSLT